MHNSFISICDNVAITEICMIWMVMVGTCTFCRVKCVKCESYAQQFDQ